MKFDWYEATLLAPVEDVGRALLGQGEGMAEMRPHRGTSYGYERAYDCAIGEQVLASMFYGGGAQGAGVHVAATGANALWFSKLCRERFAEHEVTRLDVAEDYHGPEAWSSLSGLLIELAKGRRLRTHAIGDWVQGQGGRTLYVGSSASAVRVRLYEKGKEYAARGIKNVPADWTRLEVVCRPRRRGAREFLARALPAECYGLSTWSAELLQLLSKVEVPRIVDVSWREDDDARAWRWLCRQYGPVLVRASQAHGSWEAVGLALHRSITGGS